MNKQELLTGIAFVRDVLRYCADLVRAEDRNLTDDEQKAWDEGMAYIANAERKVKQIDELERVSKIDTQVESGDAPRVTTRVSPFDTDPRSLGDAEVRNRARRALEDSDLTSHLSERQVEHLDGLLRQRTGNVDGAQIARRLLVTENEAYRSAFMKLTAESNPVLSPEESRAVMAWQEFRAMSIGTDTAGGFGVPVLIDPTIILTGQGTPNDIYDISRVETVTTNVWKGVSSAGVTWSFDAEATEVSDDSAVLAQPTVTVHKAQGFIPFSIEVGQDYPGFATEMARLLREGYNELLAEKLAIGSGSGEPFGIVTALDANTNVEVAVTTDGALGAVDVYKVWDALPQRFRRNARWLSSTDVQNEIRQFGTEDSHQFTVNLTQEDIPRLFGKQYHLNDYMADFTGTTGAANLLIVGDFQNYLIAQRAGMTVELVPHLFGSNRRPTGQRGWYAYARVGADSINDNGFRLLQNT